MPAGSLRNGRIKGSLRLHDSVCFVLVKKDNK